MKHIKKSHFLIVILLLALMAPGGLVFAGSHTQTALRQAATPTSLAPQATPIVSTPAAQASLPAQIPDSTETLSFDDFGFEEVVLRGPFASNGYYFDLPPTWKMELGAELRLVLDVYYTNADSQKPLNAAYGGALLVQYNYVTVATINLNQEGQRQVIIPLTLDTLTRLGSNQSQSIQLILDSGVNCDVNFRTTVIARTFSQLYLPHTLIDPPVDLRLLPVPFFQDSFNQDSVIIAIPDQPSISELQSALSVAAGFGRMTYNRLLISLQPVSQIAPEALASTNLIFIGKAKGLPLLQQVALPAPSSGGNFTAKESSPTDGIIQMAISPWNKSKVVMVVGGNDDAAVVNAARALSTGMLRVGDNPSLSLISNVQSLEPQYNPADSHQTFNDLGYDSVVVSEVGLNTVSYVFDVPQNYTLGPDAYLNLIFSHTSLLEYQRSGIIVKLNEAPIGSVLLSEGTSGQGEARILLPASAVQSGSNRLRLDINMEPKNECVNPLLDGLWMRIDSSSSLYLPFVPAPEISPATLIGLNRYPAPFAFDPIMNNLAFVLAPKDPVSWNVAAQIAFSLGNTNAVQLAGLEAYYADAVPDLTKQKRNLIIVGRPSNLKILEGMYDALPAPFKPGSDLAIEKNLQISYRLGSGVDVGYLELFPAPWNSKQAVLYIGGSSDSGVKWAGNALQLGRLRSQLRGNLAFISGEQIVSADTRLLQGVQGSQETSLTPAAPETQPAVSERPAWILPSIFVVFGGILFVLVILGIQAVFRKRSDK
ncbi:MAG: cellulose biosynthesis cyclic di-GMP-binding regulatory protein BcsB [Anaerolineales bacterium]|nr:cellulose biosynthesis cyclic di-GMP-binding regulatory protein BcsB [Anaerolineales bacterium]